MIGWDDIVRLSKPYVDRPFYFCDDEEGNKKKYINTQKKQKKKLSRWVETNKKNKKE